MDQKLRLSIILGMLIDAVSGTSLGLAIGNSAPGILDGTLVGVVLQDIWMQPAGG